MEQIKNDLYCTRPNSIGWHIKIQPLQFYVSGFLKNQNVKMHIVGFIYKGAAKEDRRNFAQ